MNPMTLEAAMTFSGIIFVSPETIASNGVNGMVEIKISGFTADDAKAYVDAFLLGSDIDPASIAIRQEQDQETGDPVSTITITTEN